MKKTLATAIALGAVIAANAVTPLSVDDYCDVTITRPKGVKEMTPLADGETYAAVSDDGKKIETFSYKTGRQTGTLFDIDKVKGDLKIQEFEGYELSENEKWILLWNNKEGIYRWSFTADYYVYDIMRSTMKQVSANGRMRGAVISHDGKCVAYTRDNNLFLSNLEYGTDIQITKDGKKNEIIYGVPDWGYEEEFGVQNTIHFSGDDKQIAFMRFDERDVPTYSFDAYRSYCDADPTGDPYPDAYTYKYPLAGYNNSVVSVQVYNVETKNIKTMGLPIGEKDYVPSLAFDGTGTRLMAMVLNRDQNKLTLYSVNPSSTVAKAILTETSNAWLSPSAYQMLSYGKDSFIIGSDRSGWRHLYEYSYNGRLLRQLTKGEFYVTAYYGKNPSSGKHYVQTTARGPINRSVASIDAKGNMKLLHSRDGWEDATFSKNCDYYVMNYSNALTPPQYTLWSATGKKIRDIELNGEYAAKYANAPKKEFTKVKNDAGQEMDAFLIKPADFDSSKKYPLLMYQYNGPESQEVKNKWSMEGIFYLASQGYIVATVDGRGTGYKGRAWADIVYKNLGHYETLDQIAGANGLARLPYVDADRMGCFGWSYGGYMTLRELTQPGTPFKAGVAMAAVTDWRYYDSIYTERYMLTPQQNNEGYEAASTLPRTGNLNSRLLIMSGTSDDNVHFYNTLKFTSKLGSEGKLCDMMVFTGFEHSLRMCNARTMLFRRVNQFLEQNL